VPSKGIKVTGGEEAARAFNEVKGKVEDLTPVHKRAAEMLLSDVRSATRKKTGTLAAGWETAGQAEAAQFINNEPYAAVQEFGYPPHNIEPTFAVVQAFEANEKQTEALYADAIGDIGRDAGFNTKG
jgi:hypothetical protein